MSITLCHKCYRDGYCHRLFVSLVTNEKLASSEYIRDLKHFAFDLKVKDCEWQDYLADSYRDFAGWVKDVNGKEIFLDMSEFERPSIREWFRDFCCTPCPDEVTPRVRDEARERVRVLATILSAKYPVAAQFWGVHPANDNTPQPHH